MKLALYSTRVRLGTTALFSTLLFSVSAFAGHDWVLHDETDLLLQAPACRAATAVAKSTLPVELSFAFPKDAALLPIAYVKITGLQNKAETALIRFAKKEFQPMFLYKAATVPTEPDVYWYAPKDLARLLELVKSGSAIDIAFDPKSTQPIPASFSLSGSGAVLDQVAKCTKLKDGLPTEFLKALNSQAPFSGQLPATVTAEDVQNLVQKAYKSYLDGKTAAVSLATLRKAMKPLTDKEASAQHDLDGKQKTLDASTKTLNARLDDKQKLDTEIAKLTVELQAAQTDKPVAEQDLSAKKAVYDPLKATLAPFEKDQADKTAALKKAKRNVASDQSRIEDDVNEIAHLRSRASGLRSEISSLQSELSYADSEMSRARSNLNSFNWNWEKQRYMDQQGYSSAKSQADNYEREAYSLEGQARNLQNEVSTCQSQSSSCHATAGANCSSQDAALANAQSRYSSAQSQASSARWQANSAKSRVQQIERDASSRADSERNDLQNAYNSAASRYNQIASSLSSDESELSSIVNSRIPSTQRDLADARADLPGLQAAQAQAEQNLAASNQALANERVAIGFDAVEKAYFDAVARLAGDVKTIADRNAGIATDNKALVKLAPVITQWQTTVAKQTTVRDVSQAKLTPIQTALAPQRQQEAAIVGQVDSAKTNLGEERALYQAEVAFLSSQAIEAPALAELQ